MSETGNLLFIGEAMLELVPSTEDALKKSFAGDVYNTSVYLKRAYPDNQVQFMSAVGNDPLSQDFIEQVQSEGIDTALIAQSQGKHMGLYMVQNDADGERSFIYWRNDSAAKWMMSQYSVNPEVNNSRKYQCVFFSGITLAILQEAERTAFWQFLEVAKQQGALIIFDPNYRPALWSDSLSAKQQFQIAYEQSDWLMPGLDDFKALYGLESVEECVDFCRPYGFQELVIKQGQDPVHVINTQGEQSYAIESSQNVVDTTSAGDAFNGIYIGARLAGKNIEQAVKMANFAAIKVIESPGAIMPRAQFLNAITDAYRQIEE